MFRNCDKGNLNVSLSNGKAIIWYHHFIDSKHKKKASFIECKKKGIYYFIFKRIFMKP